MNYLNNLLVEAGVGLGARIRAFEAGVSEVLILLGALVIFFGLASCSGSLRLIVL